MFGGATLDERTVEGKREGEEYSCAITTMAIPESWPYNMAINIVCLCIPKPPKLMDKESENRVYNHNAHVYPLKTARHRPSL